MTPLVSLVATGGFGGAWPATRPTNSGSLNTNVTPFPTTEYGAFQGLRLPCLNASENGVDLITKVTTPPPSSARTAERLLHTAQLVLSEAGNPAKRIDRSFILKALGG